MSGRIYRDVILEQHVRLFRGAMGAEFLFMDDNARPHRANIVDECLQSEDITPPIPKKFGNSCTLDEDDLSEFISVYDYKEVHTIKVEGEVRLLTAD
ncbi:uncharacterized protein TNCV_2639891 [Trichonephila clavipes]|nr:uncharacterized protein TNCV_2639891 [Trichonephila clavipes]